LTAEVAAENIIRTHRATHGFEARIYWMSTLGEPLAEMLAGDHEQSEGTKTEI
jgi:hypothetical protein